MAQVQTLRSNVERTLYPGYGPIQQASFAGHSSYNALTSTANKHFSHGLSVGASFTYSKAMGTTTFNPAVPNNEEWNYGRISTDRPINLQISYSYDIPGIAKKLGAKGLGYVTDHWQLSGITSVQSGAPYNPSCGLTSGSTAVTGGYTGTPDVTQRCEVISNGLTNLPTNPNGQVDYNPAAFAMPALATGPNNSIVGPPALGNLGGGAGIFDLPRITNFDVTMTKIIPLHSEKRVLKIQAQAYNVFNHAEFNGINSGIQFNPTTNQVSNLTSLECYVDTGQQPAVSRSYHLAFFQPGSSSHSRKQIIAVQQEGRCRIAAPGTASFRAATERRSLLRQPLATSASTLCLPLPDPHPAPQSSDVPALPHKSRLLSPARNSQLKLRAPKDPASAAQLTGTRATRPQDPRAFPATHPTTGEQSPPRDPPRPPACSTAYSSLIGFLQRKQQTRIIEPRLGKVRLQPDALLEVVPRFGIIAARRQHARQIHLHLGQAGLNPHRLAEIPSPHIRPVPTVAQQQRSKGNYAVPATPDRRRLLS